MNGKRLFLVLILCIGLAASLGVIGCNGDDDDDDKDTNCAEALDQFNSQTCRDEAFAVVDTVKDCHAACGDEDCHDACWDAFEVAIPSCLPGTTRLFDEGRCGQCYGNCGEAFADCMEDSGETGTACLTNLINCALDCNGPVLDCACMNNLVDEIFFDPTGGMEACLEDCEGDEGCCDICEGDQDGQLEARGIAECNATQSDFIEVQNEIQAWVWECYEAECVTTFSVCDPTCEVQNPNQCDNLLCVLGCIDDLGQCLQ